MRWKNLCSFGFSFRFFIVDCLYFNCPIFREGKQKRLEEKWLHKFAPAAKLNGRQRQSSETIRMSDTSSSEFDDSHERPAYRARAGQQQFHRAAQPPPPPFHSFTTQHLQIAKDKLGQVAATYSSKGRGPKVAAFRAAPMAYAVFKVVDPPFDRMCSCTRGVCA